MGHTARFKGILQGRDHGLLANHILKGRRAVFPRKNLIGLICGLVTHGALIGAILGGGKGTARLVHSFKMYELICNHL